MNRPQAAARRLRKSRASIDSVESVKKIEKKDPIISKVSCIVCQKPARENSIYCSQSCILAHASGVEKVIIINMHARVKIALMGFGFLGSSV